MNLEIWASEGPLLFLRSLMKVNHVYLLGT